MVAGREGGDVSMHGGGAGMRGVAFTGWEEHLGRGGRGQGGPPQRRVDEGWGAGVSGLQKHLVVRTSALWPARMVSGFGSGTVVLSFPGASESPWT